MLLVLVGLFFLLMEVVLLWGGETMMPWTDVSVA